MSKITKEIPKTKISTKITRAEKFYLPKSEEELQTGYYYEYDLEGNLEKDKTPDVEYPILEIVASEKVPYSFRGKMVNMHELKIGSTLIYRHGYENSSYIVSMIVPAKTGANKGKIVEAHLNPIISYTQKYARYIPTISKTLCIFNNKDVKGWSKGPKSWGDTIKHNDISEAEKKNYSKYYSMGN